PRFFFLLGGPDDRRLHDGAGDHGALEGLLHDGWLVDDGLRGQRRPGRRHLGHHRPAVVRDRRLAAVALHLDGGRDAVVALAAADQAAAACHAPDDRDRAEEEEREHPEPPVFVDNHHDDAQHQRDAPQTAAGRRVPGPTRLIVTNGAAAFFPAGHGAAAAAAQLGVLAHRSAAGVLADDKLIDCPARCQWLSTLIVDGRWEAPYGRWALS
ncbi:unnamed protein product, partial [Pelagomonas calceolata]